MLFNFYNGLGHSAFLEHIYLGNVSSQLDISNGIFDELEIDDTLDIVNTSTKSTDWTTDTYGQALFQNNLEMGSISNQNIPISKVRFKRKKQGSLTWETLGEVDFNNDIQNYNLKDYFVKNTETYVYSVVGLTQNQEGKGMEKTTQADYDSLFITDSDNNIAFRFNFELGDISTVQNKKFQTTLNSKFPATIYSNVKYRTGSIKALIISPTTESAYGKVNTEAENVNNENIFEVLSKDKSFLIRSNDFYGVCEISEIKQSVFDTSLTGLIQISFNITEVSESDISSLNFVGIKHYIELRA
jgi:hypothetical protein